MKKKRPGYITANRLSYRYIKPARDLLKKNMTYSEKLLWKHLRGKKLGYRFRKQYIIDSFIVDFVCLPKKLVIEVDGGIHKNQKEYDKARAVKLRKLGFKVIRFNNEKVDYYMKEVLSEIKDML